MSKTATAIIKEDPENPGERIVEFPEGFLENLGWVEGDELAWEFKDGQLSLTNRSLEEREEKAP